MNFFRKTIGYLLLIYSLALSLIIFFGSLNSGFSTGNLTLPAFSLPLIAYFLFHALRIRKGRKIFLYYSLILISIMTISGFASAKTLPQFASVFFFLPITIYFWVEVLPKNKKKIPVEHELLEIIPGTEINSEKPQKLKKIKEDKYPEKEFGKNFDLNRRMFLKLAGSAGISLFLLSIFTKKAQAAFFGSTPGPGTIALKDTSGVKIDPAQEHPTDAYKINQIDDSSPAYYGFTEKNGGWFIMKEDSSGDYRYSKGASNFSTSWTNRAGLSYDYYDVVF